ncbi:MAG TPA: PASTA domain-containing protein, partial [Terrimicrobiaceae bacterium]
MANRIFAITAAHELVTLDDQGRSQVSFTASNTGPKSIPGRAKLVSLGSTKEAWLTLEGEAERNFAKGESHQFTARIAVPPGTPMGKYSFRLNIISVENPDDEFTEGPSVSFEVKELAPAAPPKRKFPWWIVAVAGVLLVGAIIITLLLLPEKLTVPKVVGEPISKAKESLKDFASEVVGERVTGKYPPGVVVEQEPAEGTKAALGAKVALTVEANAVEVPKITGLSLADADAKLKKIKLQLKTDTRSANATTGTITEQDPKSGLRVAAGATVTALVEPEQQMVIVPDFIGVPIEKVPSMLPGNLGFQVNNPPIITGKVAI